MSDAIVEVTIVPLRIAAAMIPRALALLDERERAADQRLRYVFAHAAARVVLGEHLGVDPQAVVVGAEAGGRPTVDGVAFNLSHSGELAAIALAEPGMRIGVDVEEVRERRHLDGLARRVLDRVGYEAWRALAEGERPLVFAQRWTEVEAVLKAQGTGIAGGFAAGRNPPPGWSCTAIDVGARHVGAVAADCAPIEVRVRTLHLDDALRRRGGAAR